MAEWLVVGCGLTGATFAERIATVLGDRVRVIDRRPHIAGNAFDRVDEHGLLIHQYGAHIFHTSSERVWNYLSRFTDWRPYEHRVLGQIDGQLLPIPFNLTTLRALVPGRAGSQLEALLLESVGYGGRIPVLKLLESENGALRQLGELVYQKVFSGYSAKQWDRKPEELDRSISARVPIVVSRDDRYFHDPFQGLPAEGYTAMVARMLDHPNIEVYTGLEYREVGTRFDPERLVFTGPLDELMGYRLGALPYRSLRFETEHYPVEYRQPVAVVNYPNEHAYTRRLEHKHLTGQSHPETAVTTEWPQPHLPGETEPYFPVPAQETRAWYRAYRTLVEGELPGVILSGRLADYRYYDMDQAVSRALIVFRERVLGGRRPLVPAK